MTDVSVI